MIDGQCTRVSNNHSELRLAGEGASASSGAYQAWRQLGPDSRLDLIEQALDWPANDLADNLPIAL